MRWPNVIKPGSVCTSLVQTTDFVPTFFDVTGAKTPEEYGMDGVNLRPVFADATSEIHDHLYFELGNARAVRTVNWKYIAIRYDTEQFQRIQSADLMRLPRALAYIGNDKNLSNHLSRRSHLPYVRKLTNLKPIKRGFEIVGQTRNTGDSGTEARRPEERKRKREERRKEQSKNSNNE